MIGAECLHPLQRLWGRRVSGILFLKRFPDSSIGSAVRLKPIIATVKMLKRHLLTLLNYHHYRLTYATAEALKLTHPSHQRPTRAASVPFKTSESESFSSSANSTSALLEIPRKSQKNAIKACPYKP